MAQTLTDPIGPDGVGPVVSDLEDGRPVRDLAEGQPLVPGAYAWRRLGVGVRCETWLAWNPERWHPLVVKLPRPHLVRDPRAWATLAREVYVLSRAAHPALPRLYADRTGSALPHVLMEYVDAPTLADLLDDGGPLDVGSTVQLGATLLSALVAVHATGAIHADVKPDNVLVRDGRPVLIDFGSARPVGSRQPPGRPLGTLGYAAPEMERCEPLGPAMDVYGVGVVLRDALADGPRSVDPTRRPRSARQRARAGLHLLIDRLTGDDPGLRDDAGTVLADLQAATATPLAPVWADGLQADRGRSPIGQW